MWRITIDHKTVSKYWLVWGNAGKRYPIYDDLLLEPIRELVSIANKKGAKKRSPK